MDADRLSILAEYRCYIKEKLQYGAAGADTSSRARPFVCHSTPHIDSTSREVPTLFFLIIHEMYGKVNPYFHIFHRLLKRKNAEKTDFACS